MLFYQFRVINLDLFLWEVFLDECVWGVLEKGILRNSFMQTLFLINFEAFATQLLTLWKLSVYLLHPPECKHITIYYVYNGEAEPTEVAIPPAIHDTALRGTIAWLQYIGRYSETRQPFFQNNPLFISTRIPHCYATFAKQYS